MELQAWRDASFYCSDDDFILPSIMKNGSQPMWPDMILRDTSSPEKYGLHQTHRPALISAWARNIAQEEQSRRKDESGTDAAYQ